MSDFVAYVVSTVALLLGSILTLAAGFVYGPGGGAGARVAGQRHGRDVRVPPWAHRAARMGPASGRAFATGACHRRRSPRAPRASHGDRRRTFMMLRSLLPVVLLVVLPCGATSTATMAVPMRRRAGTRRSRFSNTTVTQGFRKRDNEAE